MLKKFIGVLAVLHIVVSAFPQEPPFLKYMNHPWVDSVFATLDTREKIAQSIWMAAWSDKDASHSYEISKLIEHQKIGGLIFFQGTASKEAGLINHYQSISEVPLLFAMDAEWGPGMRLNNITDFPYQMTLGAIQNDSLIYKMGLDIARQLKRLGIHQNLAPVADINNNPENPVINYRSFGENKIKVANKSYMYSMGLQDGGIAATAKHFPGHGDTNTDSHHALPQINHPKERFDTLELIPFKKLIDNGISSVMSAHLNIPAYDSVAYLPSTLSPNIIEGLLKQELAFRGLVITDAMNMKGVTDYYKDGIADALAYAAGNDVLEYVADAENTIDSILSFLEQGKITQEKINLSCRKILALKYWCGLNNVKNINEANIDSEINKPASLALIHDLYSSAITVLKNDENILPVKHLESNTVACVTVNGRIDSYFSNMAAKYTRVSKFSWKSGSDYTTLLNKLKEFDIVLLTINGTDQRPYRNFGVTEDINQFLYELGQISKLVVVYPGNPYAIDILDGLSSARGLILAYQENRFTNELAAQLIFGGISGHGKLPVTINDNYKEGFGLITPGNIRLKYGYPENGGLSSQSLNKKIDSIVNLGLTAGAFPGCEVIAARKGVVVFHKTYGYHTYLKRKKIEAGDIFDLASVTKVSAATAGLMALDNLDLFDPDDEIGEYIKYFNNSDKEHLNLRDILSHQAGLEAWIPYWKNTVNKNGKFKSHTFKPAESNKYSIRVSENLYLKRNYKKKMFKQIKKSPIGEPKYLYSGLMFYVFPDIISSRSGVDYEQFLYQNVYRPLGAYDIVFNPYKHYHLETIVPTEIDLSFRNTQLLGYVHDEGAAMMGGLSGNAGLFATANDLIKLFEMFRNYGSYGGEQLIDPNIVKDYTSYQFVENNNRRGLGFDKPLLPDTTIARSEIYPCPSASPGSFGHSGYTGTFVWADPEEEISYVFLSNRVYPTRDNNKISSMNIRTDILQSIYDSIIEY